MIFTRTFFLLSLLLLSGPAACGQAEKQTSPKSVYDAYQSGKSVILFSYNEKDKNTEAFADWEAYLIDFKQGNGHNYIYIKVGAEALGDINPKPTEFTLFLKKDFPIYYYDSFIVEPQVYHAVHKVYTSIPLEDVDRAFLPENIERKMLTNLKK